MRVLFDQGTPIPTKYHLPQHEVVTAREKGWNTLLNGGLLAAAEADGFEVLVTTDTHLADQQNLRGRKLAIVVLSRNRWKSIEANLDRVVSAINNTVAGSYTVIDI